MSDRRPLARAALDFLCPLCVDVGFTLAQCNRYCLSAVV